MSIVDLIIIVVMCLSVLVGFIRGFIKEVLSVCLWLAAIICAVLYTQDLQLWLVDYIEIPGVRVSAAFAIIFFVVFLVGSLVNRVLANVLQLSGFGLINRLLGVVFGAGRGILLIIAALLLLSPTAITKDIMFQESLLVPLLEPYVLQVANYMHKNVNYSYLQLHFEQIG